MSYHLQGICPLAVAGVCFTGLLFPGVALAPLTLCGLLDPTAPRPLASEDATDCGVGNPGGEDCGGVAEAAGGHGACSCNGTVT